MFLQLAYKELKIVSLSKKLVRRCYELAQEVPTENTGNLVQQFKQAALNTHLSISEGAFRRSRKKQRTFFKKAQRSLIVTDAAFEVLYELGYVSADAADEVSILLVNNYKLLKKLIRKK